VPRRDKKGSVKKLAIRETSEREKKNRLRKFSSHREMFQKKSEGKLSLSGGTDRLERVMELREGKGKRIRTDCPSKGSLGRGVKKFREKGVKGKLGSESYLKGGDCVKKVCLGRKECAGFGSVVKKLKAKNRPRSLMF